MVSRVSAYLLSLCGLFRRDRYSCSLRGHDFWKSSGVWDRIASGKSPGIRRRLLSVNRDPTRRFSNNNIPSPIRLVYRSQLIALWNEPSEKTFHSSLEFFANVKFLLDSSDLGFREARTRTKIRGFCKPDSLRKPRWWMSRTFAEGYKAKRAYDYKLSMTQRSP